MFIGIKYCGGCNSTYDRKKFAEKIVLKFKEINFETVYDNNEYDVMLIICGCSRACANHKNLICKEKIIVASELDFNKINDLIRNLQARKYEDLN